MIEFTKEQLIARIAQVSANYKARLNKDPELIGLAMDIELFAIALASLTAEPVAVICFDKNYTRRDGSKPNWNEMPKVVSCNCLPDGDYPVYLTAPPEPVSVFDIDHESSLIKHVKKVAHGISSTPAPVMMTCRLDGVTETYADGRSACRAAMLQGAETKSYTVGEATMRHIFTPGQITNVSDLQAVFDRIEEVLSEMEGRNREPRQ